MTSHSLVLASQSPRRLELLKQVGLECIVCPARGEEPSPNPSEQPQAYAIRTALYKAQAVQKEQTQSDVWILAADTIVIIDETILGKPQTTEHAAQMLNRLSGRSHQVITAFALLNKAQQVEYTEAVETSVHFTELSQDEIQSYIASGEPMDKAGSYGIQGTAARFIRGIEGCYSNVVGLPVQRVVSVLKQHSWTSH